MGFLDNLESSLKHLEAQDERDAPSSAQKTREREEAMAVAPWAERLKSASYTQALLAQSSAAGHALRSKMYMSWMGSTLRLEIKGHFCELSPNASGIEARFQRLSDNSEQVQKIDLDSDNPDHLLRIWLGSL